MSEDRRVVDAITELEREPDAIDALVDQQLANYPNRSGYNHNVRQSLCPRCREDWHTVPITERMASIRHVWRRYVHESRRIPDDVAKLLDDYRYDQDDSRVLCPGSHVPIVADDSHENTEPVNSTTTPLPVLVPVLPPPSTSQASWWAIETSRDDAVQLSTLRDSLELTPHNDGPSFYQIARDGLWVTAAYAVRKPSTLWGPLHSVYDMRTVRAVQELNVTFFVQREADPTTRAYVFRDLERIAMRGIATQVGLPFLGAALHKDDFVVIPRENLYPDDYDGYTVNWRPTTTFTLLLDGALAGHMVASATELFAVPAGFDANGILCAGYQRSGYHTGTRTWTATHVRDSFRWQG